MNFNGTLKDLGTKDIFSFQQAVNECEASSWHENLLRQKQFDVHYQTQSLLLLFCECSDWPNVQVSKEHAWSSFSEYAEPLMESIIEEHYQPGGVVIRAVLAKLDPGAIIKPHIDSHPSFSVSHRIHVPITTNNKVRFMIDGRPHHLQTNNVYEVNNLKNHSVMNKGSTSRITFIFDYVPPGQMHQIKHNQSDSV